MSPKPIRDFLDDPLLGCDENVLIPSNTYNVYHSVLLRLRLFHPGERARELADRIADECEATGLEPGEYLINEILYEMRRAQRTFNPAFEEVVLKNWTKLVLKKYGEDVGLSFYTRLKEVRESRKR